MIKAKLTKNRINNQKELHIWVERDINEWELKELILFVESMKSYILIEKLDSTDYEDLKDGWRLRPI